MGQHHRQAAAEREEEGPGTRPGQKAHGRGEGQRAEREVERVVPDRPRVEPEVRGAEQRRDEPGPEPERAAEPEEREREDRRRQDGPERHQRHEIRGDGQVGLVHPGGERPVRGAGGAGQPMRRGGVVAVGTQGTRDEHRLVAHPLDVPGMHRRQEAEQGHAGQERAMAANPFRDRAVRGGVDGRVLRRARGSG